MGRKNSGDKRGMAAGVLIALLAGLPAAVSGHGMAANYQKPAGMNLREATYADGTYAGTATGYRPGLEVSVSVKKGTVTGISVIAHNEVDRRFYDFPIRVIPGEILKKQSTKVDVVSGATATSYGIMSAVENALSKAK